MSVDETVTDPTWDPAEDGEPVWPADPAPDTDLDGEPSSDMPGEDPGGNPFGG